MHPGEHAQSLTRGEESWLLVVGASPTPIPRIPAVLLLLVVATRAGDSPHIVDGRRVAGESRLYTGHAFSMFSSG